jgi:hypothetical protein
MQRTVTVVAIGVAVATAAVLVSRHVEPQPPKRVKEVYSNTYWKGPAATLTETILAVDAVVRGRVLGGEPRDTKDNVTTAYRFKVDEIIHALGGHPVDESEITILRNIGDRDRGAYIERTIDSDFPPFELGQQYVVFLNWDPYRDAWVPGIGPDSVIDITTAVVRSPGYADLTKAQKGKPAAEYLELLRRLGRK